MIERLIEIFLQLTGEEQDKILALLEEPNAEAKNPD